ncbi:MAG: hypothetical protein ROW48_08355 [Bellilinea sp.]|jgi:dUTP pyrophosphatase
MQTIHFARLRPEAKLPSRKHPADAGIDLYAALPVEIAANSLAIVPTGVCVDIPAGYVGLLKPKGRSNHLLGAGVVDAGYQGEILVKVANPTAQPLRLEAGDPVGQMLILPVLTPQVREVSPDDIFPQASQRGASGGIVDQANGG